MKYLEKRGLMHPELVKHFKLGLSNKTLMYRLPAKHTKAGMAIRETLKQVGVLRQKMGVEHFAGCLVVPVLDERGQVQEIYGRRSAPRLKKIIVIGIYPTRIEACLISRRLIHLVKSFYVSPWWMRSRSGCMGLKT